MPFGSPRGLICDWPKCTQDFKMLHYILCNSFAILKSFQTLHYIQASMLSTISDVSIWKRISMPWLYGHFGAALLAAVGDSSSSILAAGCAFSPMPWSYGRYGFMLRCIFQHRLQYWLFSGLTFDAEHATTQKLLWNFLNSSAEKNH